MAFNHNFIVFLLSVLCIAPSPALAGFKVGEDNSLSLRDSRTQLRLADCSFSSKSLDDCDFMNYGIRVAIQGGIPLILFFILLFSFPFYISFRFCCDCCGGRRQTYGYCCPVSREEHNALMEEHEREEAKKRESLLKLQRRNTAFSPSYKKDQSSSVRYLQPSAIAGDTCNEVDREESEMHVIDPTTPQKATSAGPLMPSAIASYPNNDAPYPGSPQYSLGHASSPVKSTAVRYTLFDILRVKIITWFILLVFGGGLAWGLLGSFKIMAALDDSIDGLVSIPDTILTRVAGIVNEMEFVSYSASTDTYANTNYMLSTTEGRDAYTSINNTADDMRKLIVDATADAQKQLKAYNFVPLLVFCVPCLFPLLGSIFAIFNIRTFFPLFNMFWMTIFGAIMWFLQVIFCIAAIAVNDVANEVNALTNDKMNVLLAVTGCKDSDFSSIKTTFSDMARVEARNLCADLKCYNDMLTPMQNVQNGDIIDCTPVSGLCPTITATDMFSKLEFNISLHANIKLIPNYLDNGLWCADDGSTCLLPSCSETCLVNATSNDTSTQALSQLGKTSKEVIYTLRGVRKVMQVFDKHAVLLSSCQPLFALALTPVRKPLNDLRDGLMDVRSAAAMYGLAFIAGVIVMAWGAKRFISFSLANVEIVYHKSGVQPDSSDPQITQQPEGPAAVAYGGGMPAVVAYSPHNGPAADVPSPTGYRHGGESYTFMKNSFAQSPSRREAEGSHRTLPNRRSVSKVKETSTSAENHELFGAHTASFTYEVPTMPSDTVVKEESCGPGPVPDQY